MTRTALVTGVTGYVGGLVARRLLDEGWRVRALTRDPSKLGELADHASLESLTGDATDEQDMSRAMEGVDVAWYLLHSMGEGDFVSQDREMAEAFAHSAASAGVQRIVYLGGLHPEGDLSEHLASRVEVGEILLDSGVPTAALQAGVLLGDGSSSFEMLRHLAERLPVAVAPKWINNSIQPIAADDAVHYLVRAAELPAEVNRTFDIGGPDVLTYAEMMKRYASALRLGPRLVGTAPVTTPELAAHWIGLVTPIPTTLARPLIGSLLHDTLVKERDIDDYIRPPAGGLTGFDDAVRAAASAQSSRRWLRTLATWGAAVGASAAISILAAHAPGGRRLRPGGWARSAAGITASAELAVISALIVADAGEAGLERERRDYGIALATHLALAATWSVARFRLGHAGLTRALGAARTGSALELARRGRRSSPERGVALSVYAAWTGIDSAASD